MLDSIADVYVDVDVDVDVDSLDQQRTMVTIQLVGSQLETAVSNVAPPHLLQAQYQSRHLRPLYAIV